MRLIFLFIETKSLRGKSKIFYGKKMLFRKKKMKRERIRNIGILVKDENDEGYIYIYVVYIKHFYRIALNIK